MFCIKNVKYLCAYVHVHSCLQNYRVISAVRITVVKSRWLWARWLGFSPQQSSNFSFCHDIQISSGTHPAPIAMGNRVFYPAVKWAENRVDQSPPSSSEIDMWRFVSMPLYAFMCCLDTGKFSLLTLQGWLNIWGYSLCEEDHVMV